MRTNNGIEFEIISKIDDSWCNYDKTIAKKHLHTYGMIFVDPVFNAPIDNVFAVEEIVSFWLTTQVITKEQIKEGLDKKVINIVNNEDGYIVAQIGEYWFYFVGNEEDLSPAEEYLSFCDRTELIDTIHQAINDEPIKGRTWDESSEWLYYRATLLETKGK